MSKTQSERIADLEVVLAEALCKINELVAMAQPLAAEIKRVDARVDHAGVLFKDMRRALTPKSEPQRVARAAFDAALAELRSDAGNDRAYFPREVILERAAARAQLVRQAEAA